MNADSIDLRAASMDTASVPIRELGLESLDTGSLQRIADSLERITTAVEHLAALAAAEAEARRGRPLEARFFDCGGCGQRMRAKPGETVARCATCGFSTRVAP